MVKVPLYNPQGEFVKTVEVDPAAIAPSVNADLIRQAVLAAEANRRQGTAKTKERSEIAGSSKKPWRQKGTGRARAGHKRSPLWRGGGVIFGPHPREYRHRMPVKARRNACAGALRAKVEDGEVAFIEAWRLEAEKTKTVAALLKAMRAGDTALLGTTELDSTLWRCARNIPGVQVIPVDQVNAWHLARYRRVLLTPDGFEKLKGRVSPPAQEVAR